MRLLDLTKHVKVWLSYAKFEHEVAHSATNARAVFKQANSHFRESEPDLKQERKLVLESWLAFESDTSVNKNGPNSKKAQAVSAKLPKKVVRKREGHDGEWEEVEDLDFPEDS